MSCFEHFADAEGQYLQACSRGDCEELRNLVASGMVDIEVKSAGQAWRGLHRASMAGHHKVISLLLALGTDLEARAADGRTALHYAAAEGQTQTALVLIQHKANLEARDTIGTTPLLCAARRAHVETIVNLILKGAAVDAMDNLGRGLLSLFGNIARLSARERQAAVKAMNEARSFYLRSVEWDSKLVDILGAAGIHNRVDLGTKAREAERGARPGTVAGGGGEMHEVLKSADRRKAALKAKGWTVGNSRWACSPAPPPPPRTSKTVVVFPLAHAVASK